jgi:hypothetical protein
VRGRVVFGTRYILLLDIQIPVVYMRVDDSRPDVSFSIFPGLNVMVRLKLICLISRQHHNAAPLRMLMFLAPRQKLGTPSSFAYKTMRSTGCFIDCWLTVLGILVSMVLCFRSYIASLEKLDSVAKGDSSMAGFEGCTVHCLRLKSPLSRCSG